MKPSFRFTLLALGLAAAACSAQAQLKPAAPAKAAPAAAPAATNEGVVSNPDYEKAGQTAAHAWLLLLDRKDWGTAWDASSALFRQNVPLGVWMDNVPKLRDPLGAFVERQPAEALYKKSLPGHPAGDYVTVFFRSKFDKKADVLETVTTVREPDGRWRVTGYTAR
jgi:hypothetical protein